MRSLSRNQRVALALPLILFVLVFLMACDDTEAVSDYFDDFFGSQSSAEQAANATGRTGDEGADGILDAMETVNDIQKADDIYAQSKPLVANHGTDDQRAADLLDQAIALRPDDMRYRRDRVRIALIQDDATIARQQWEEQDRIAASTGADNQLWYWEGCFLDAAQAAIDMVSVLGDNPLGYTAAQDRRAVVVYTRMADAAERTAGLNTLSANVQQAAVQMQLADEYREKAKRHGGQ